MVPPLDENDAVPGTGAHGARARRPVVAGILLALLLVAAGTGVYALVQNLKTSSSVTALDNLCNSVGYAVQLAYDHKGNLETFHKMVDREAAAAGGPSPFGHNRVRTSRQRQPRPQRRERSGTTGRNL